MPREDTVKYGQRRGAAMATAATAPQSHGNCTGVPPNLLRGQIERTPSGEFLWWCVQPHWVPAVMAAAPSWGCGRMLVIRPSGLSPTACQRSSRSLLPGGTRVRGGGFSPTGFRRSSRVLLPDALHTHGYEEIENFNSMVTERYITRITVSRQGLPGQAANQAATIQNWSQLVTISHERPRSYRGWYRCVVGS
jgi:hypothetical protein